MTKLRQAALWLALASSAPGAAFAQQAPATAAPPPSQVAPPVLAPTPTPGRVGVPEAPPEVAGPEAAKTLSFVLTGVDVEGEFDDLAAARRELEAPLVGKRITVAQLFEFANNLQQAYVRAGYILARVVVPPQQLENRARVKLQVIDGFIEQIDAGVLAPQVRERVSVVLAPLIGRRHLMLAFLERRLLIAGDTPGLVLNSTLSAGKQIGGTVLTLTGTYRPVSLIVYTDDSMPKTFGTWQVVTSVSENSVFGFGEQISLQAAGFPDRDFTTEFPTRRYLSGNMVLPLGIDGLRLEATGTNGKTTPRVIRLLASQGLLNQGRVGIAYDVVKRRDSTLTLAARFNATDEQLNTLITMPPTPLYLDRVRPLRFSADGIFRLRESGMVVVYGANLSRGVDWAGARTANAATPLLPLSRAGADAVFQKLDAHLEVSQTLPQDFFVTAMAFGQTPFGKPMLNSEMFDITGAKMLSGFTAGALIGDRAWVARAEVGRPFALPVEKVALTLTPYLFAANGERILENPSVLEIASAHATSRGGGIRFHMATAPADMLPNGYGFVEYSRNTTNLPILGGWRIFTGWLLTY